MKTYDEMRKLVGIEFTYLLKNGDTIPAIVASFDEKVGFTCLATSDTSSDGGDFSLLADENGEICLISAHHNSDYFLEYCDAALTEIEEDGTYTVIDYDRFIQGYSPNCHF